MSIPNGSQWPFIPDPLVAGGSASNLMRLLADRTQLRWSELIRDEYRAYRVANDVLASTFPCA
jgi:hypothetical protein